ncbi:hypothetical protein ASPWEDRAFT_170092 [Aspergillus wentii DTO 134E9]|uniref:UBC core domain-containing protein n=1 Tax=Aspergillus wentii DTO 134E9 TaxID=1073089 RepID=A0A1L9RNQ5_ASPWE|nr:uncharacterized protein ASPWEDRAFT_170092 [Aspergillus wentii DTO 134E9]OJJ36580.1 hypothetical protein ASPWEDRAFT_170092 [Aspergillus wentii DTO 134E9]
MDSIQAGDSNSRKFDLDDACRLKSDPSLVGFVTRTYYDADTHGPLNHLLVLSYSSVPQHELTEFLETGAPSKGYVFVSFAEPSQGSSLIHEDDLDLVNRPMPLGQIVKRGSRDTISGTVISTSRKCDIEPVAYRTLDPTTGDYGPLQFTEKAVQSDFEADKTDDLESRILRDIPLSELQHYEPFNEGDYIVYRQKVGVIQNIDRDVVLLLQNQTAVSPLNPSALEIPLDIGSKPIVSLPSLPDTVKLKPLGNGESVWTTEPQLLYPGQYAFTTSRNLRSGYWISGAYSGLERPEGHVIATPAMDIHVDWLCPNVFSVGGSCEGPSKEVIRASTLEGHAVKCDFGKLPSGHFKEQTVKSDIWLSIGDRVRFRDPIDAAAKYSQYQPIPSDQSLGYDLNVFRIISSKTEVTIQWQDLSITTEDATAVHRATETEAEVWPGNLVVLREAVEKVHAHMDGGYETLRPKKIGVVQIVDSRERIASVRWYKDPDVELLHEGNMLRASSVLGELGDITTDVSLYELSSYPSLSRSLDNLVLLVPDKVHQSLVPSGATNVPPMALGTGLHSFLGPIAFSQACMYLEDIKEVIVTMDWFKNTTEVDSSSLPPRFSFHRDEHGLKTPVDFIGRIIAIGTDGTIIVRLAGADNCRDIRVPREKILMVIDDESAAPIPPFSTVSTLSNLQSAISALLRLDESSAQIYTALEQLSDETFEYDGGERLDDDSGDYLWMTEDESDDRDEEGDLNVEQIETDDDSDGLVSKVAEISAAEKSDSEEEDSHIKHEITESLSLSSSQAESCPASFYVLESPPPSDHNFLSKSMLEASGPRLKRIRKEYDILKSSLPPGIFVRTWESRIDLMRALIIGPQGTPYEYAPFVIDFHLQDDFPNSPPASFFHSWANGSGMINPNLYEDGKICLSILGTWPTKNPDERWSPFKSTILQVLVSIMGLVLVKTPFYNEAGYEVLAAEDKNRVESAQYTEKAFLMTRTFIKHALENPVAGFEDILTWNYLPDLTHNYNSSNRPRLLQKAIDEALTMIEHHNNTSRSQELDEHTVASPFVRRLSLGAVVMLRKHITALEKIVSDLIPGSAPE